MSRLSRVTVISVLGVASMLVACHDGLLHPAAPRAASLDMVVSFQRAAGGPTEAYDRADGALVRFRSGDEVRSEQVLPFASSGAETVLRADVPLRQVTETMTVDLDLQSTGRALFRGSGSATFSAGASSTVRLTLAPVIATVTCAGPLVQFGAYGDVQALTAAALFATGDTVVGAPISWSADNSSVVNVGATGLISALSDGDATVSCTSGSISGTRAVKVFAVVNRVELAPAVVTLVVGDTLSLKPTLRDSVGHVITSPRPISWSTTNAAAVTVSATGKLTAIAPGAAQITATSASAAGTAAITVVQTPDVTTQSATSITASGATLNGTVNPHGSAAQAWFQYGTSATLATFSETQPQSAGSDTTSTPLAASVTNLQPITTYFYRIVASNAVGNAQGSILSFKTGGAPPSLANTSGLVNTTCGLACFSSTTMSTNVNPNGLPTDVWFEYSTDSTFKSYSATPRQAAGSGTTFITINAAAPGAVYFRAAAQNILGTVRTGIIVPSAG